jgi:hypothetical protein
MNDYDPSSPDETFPTRPVSSATSGPSTIGSSGDAGAAPPDPSASSLDSSARVTTATPGRRPRLRRMLWNQKRGRIVAAAVMVPVIGLSVGLATSPSASAGQLASGAGRWRPSLRRRGIERSLWAGRRGSIRHGRQRVQVDLHADDISGPESDGRRDILHEVPEGDELDLGQRHDKGRTRPRPWDDQWNDHQGHAGHRAND